MKSSIATLREALRRCADALLDAPCIFCGYQGADYWQRGTHAPDCRWHVVGGFDERRTALIQDGPCKTCNDDPAVCATVPGLRHCESAMREQSLPCAARRGTTKWGYVADNLTPILANESLSEEDHDAIAAAINYLDECDGEHQHAANLAVSSTAGVTQELIDACELLLDYRRRNTGNFQLEKADDYLKRIDAALDGITPSATREGSFQERHPSERKGCIDG